MEPAKSSLKSFILAAAVSIATGQAPSDVGRFGDLINTEVLPIHVFMLPNGKLVYIDRHDAGTHKDRLPRLFDLSTGISTKLPDPGYDLFCSGHSYLRNGPLVISGGLLFDSTGEPGIRIFNPATNTFD